MSSAAQLVNMSLPYCLYHARRTCHFHEIIAHPTIVYPGYPKNKAYGLALLGLIIIRGCTTKIDRRTRMKSGAQRVGWICSAF